MASLNTIAQKIVNAQEKVPYYPGENLLFKYLYDAYCKLERPDDNFEAVVADANLAGNNSSDKYGDARQALVSWYADRYHPQDKKNARQGFEGRELTDLDAPKKKKTNRGIARDVFQRNIEDGIYRFDEPVNPGLFKVYLNDFSIQQHPFQTADARSFILHTAVAFLLSPEQLNHLLVTFGFHPLHVRHIHDMAIFVVLQDAAQNWTSEERRERNPFQEVWDVYESARLLLIRAQTTEPHDPSEDERIAFQSDSTRAVEKYILKQKLSRENLLAYVSCHAEFYNLRHRRLLEEHRRLVDLFSELYMRRGDALPESQYSLYQFLSAFCKDFERKRFNDQIYVHVAKNQRHPTRELMIVLWIYAYSFLFYPKVSAFRDFSKVIPFKAISKALEEPLEYPFANYFDKHYDKLRVLEYLSDTSNRASSLCGFYDGSTVRGEFKGNELVTFINEKLKDYSWRQLDRKNSFDRIVQCLSPLQITMDDGDIERASYGRENIDDAERMNVDNVPTPLVVISKLLQCIKDVENKGVKNTERQKLPLSCDLYELI